jgi:hypothetical protein
MLEVRLTLIPLQFHGLNYLVLRDHEIRELVRRCRPLEAILHKVEVRGTGQMRVELYLRHVL